MLKRAKNKPQKGIRLMQIIFAYFPCLGDDGRGAHNTNFYRGPQRLSPGLVDQLVSLTFALLPTIFLLTIRVKVSPWPTICPVFTTSLLEKEFDDDPTSK